MFSLNIPKNSLYENRKILTQNSQIQFVKYKILNILLIPVIITHVRDFIAKNDILEDSSWSFNTSFGVEHDWTSKRRCYTNIQKGFCLKAGMVPRHVEMPATEKRRFVLKRKVSNANHETFIHYSKILQIMIFTMYTQTNDFQIVQKHEMIMHKCIIVAPYFIL